MLEKLLRPVIALVAAMAENHVIGAGGDIPWRLKGEQAHFKAVTMGKPVIMGRKTWESLPRRPLPGRKNIILTQKKNYTAAGGETVASIETALLSAGSVEEAAVIGGEQIYRLFLPHADILHLTLVHAEVQGDAFFPAYDPAEWECVEQHTVPEGEGIDYAYTLQKLIRRA